MQADVTRRGVLQLFAALTAAVPVLTRGASAPSLPVADAPPSERPQAESVDRPSRPMVVSNNTGAPLGKRPPRRPLLSR